MNQEWVEGTREIVATFFWKNHFILWKNPGDHDLAGPNDDDFYSCLTEIYDIF